MLGPEIALLMVHFKLVAALFILHPIACYAQKVQLAKAIDKY